MRHLLPPCGAAGGDRTAHRRRRSRRRAHRRRRRATTRPPEITSSVAICFAIRPAGCIGSTSDRAAPAGRATVDRRRGRQRDHDLRVGKVDALACRQSGERPRLDAPRPFEQRVAGPVPAPSRADSCRSSWTSGISRRAVRKVVALVCAARTFLTSDTRVTRPDCSSVPSEHSDPWAPCYPWSKNVRASAGRVLSFRPDLATPISTIGAWRSLVAHSLGVRVVGRSNRLAPTRRRGTVHRAPATTAVSGSECSVACPQVGW